ncbi:MAG: hypothetical protein WCB70_21140, partial [Xanthobacteraceae bacterium]
MFLRHQVLEVRNVEGRIHVARKPRRHDEWDPPIPVYDPLRARRRIHRRLMSVIDNDRPVSAYTEPVIDYSERKEQVRQAVR